MHSVSKHMRLSELTVKIWMKIDLYCRRHRCSPMTLVSANIRFVPIFEGVSEGVKRQWGNRKHGFSRLSTLRLRQLWKSGQSYYTVISFVACPVTAKYLTFDDSERREYPAWVRRPAAWRTHWTLDLKILHDVTFTLDNNWDNRHVVSCCYFLKMCCYRRRLVFNCCF